MDQGRWVRFACVCVCLEQNTTSSRSVLLYPVDVLQCFPNAKCSVGYALSHVLDVLLGVDADCLMLVLILFLFCR